ncbi:uncharacterized protein TRUGW13939_09313 [Talaromyces rugulosus]|uniref:Uncharacterized protein n=1 Tax=Talaromyces rugulosus TaxID=121627 RepID=A0A7H8R7G6_TALRU|nr:uncharacterized protein TRUGW13939_09313 [Talaromyces rugulosus]QKX62156.1 hypothetical protein TRUGW13939_09313 [Talaromyces rugulosus]
MSSTVNPSNTKGADVYEASGLPASFNKTKTLTEVHSLVSLGVVEESKIMLRLRDASLQCQAIATTSSISKQYVVMIIQESLVALYRIEHYSSTLNQVPFWVDFFVKELEKITGINVTSEKEFGGGFSMIFAARELDELDDGYHEVYLTLGQALQEKFGFPQVTCYRYKTGSALHAAFIGSPDKMPHCYEVERGGNIPPTTINYMEMPVTDYSLAN